MKFFFILLFTQLAFAQEDLLKRLVEIDSGTSQIENVDRVQDVIKSHLDELGFKTTYEVNPLGPTKSGKLLIGILQGETSDFITFITHADTVFEKNSGFSGYHVEGDSARGPGVIDDKGGLVVALDGLRQYLSSHKKPHYSLRFISSPSEETGSEGFIEDFKKISLATKLVLGFEPSLDDGSIVESRRGNRWYLISITGREAHAGRDHKKGINACLDLANKISKISSFTDYAKDVTVSIGRIEGGQDKYNVVCGFAQAKIDTRFSSIEQRDILQKKIDQVISGPAVHSALDDVAASVKIETANDCPPFSVSPESQKFIHAYQDAVFSVEKVKSKSVKSPGSADSNNFSRPGVAIIDGLGPTGGGMHTKEEHLALSSLKTRAEALAKFLESL
jgi:glutamate carboxypeptidase